MSRDKSKSALLIVVTVLLSMTFFVLVKVADQRNIAQAEVNLLIHQFCKVQDGTGEHRKIGEVHYCLRQTGAYHKLRRVK